MRKAIWDRDAEALDNRCALCDVCVVFHAHDMNPRHLAICGCRGQQLMNAGHVKAAADGGLATEDNLALICAGRLSQFTPIRLSQFTHRLRW